MRPVLMAIAMAACLSLPAAAADPSPDGASDPRISENPALAALHAADPDAAMRVLDEIEALDEELQGQLPKGATRGAIYDDVDEDERRVLDENPLFRELYARDRGATLKLIKLVIGE